MHIEKAIDEIKCVQATLNQIQTTDDPRVRAELLSWSNRHLTQARIELGEQLPSPFTEDNTR